MHAMQVLEDAQFGEQPALVGAHRRQFDGGPVHRQPVADGAGDLGDVLFSAGHPASPPPD